MIEQLIDETVKWEEIGEYPRESLKYQVGKPRIIKESSSLELPLSLNFVMPFNDSERIRALLTDAIKGVKDVNLVYSYNDVIMSEEDTLRNSVEHIAAGIRGKLGLIAKTIKGRDCRIDGENVVIPIVGERFADLMNKEAAKTFESYWKTNFGISKTVCFENAEAECEEIRREREEISRRELEKVKKAAEGAKCRKETEDTARVASGGGNGNGKSNGNGSGGQDGGGSGKAGNGNGGSNGYSGKSGYGNGSGGQNGGGGWRRAPKYQPVKGNIILGAAIDEKNMISLSELEGDGGEVSIGGILFKKDFRVTRTGKHMVTLLITDKKTSVCLKLFTSSQKWDDIDQNLESGDYIKVQGTDEFDEYEKTPVVMLKSIEKGEAPPARQDTCEEKRVELHAHTKMSAMDGLNEVENLVRTSAKWGHPAVAVTDHGVVQSFPDAAAEAKALSEKGIKIKIIYGVEGYVFDDSDCVKEDGTIDYKSKPTNHIILIAKNQQGLKNIYKLVSYSHINYFYKKPRLPWSVIEQHREGLIIGSACEAGEVFRSLRDGAAAEKTEAIAARYDYLEIQPIINNRFMLEEGIVKDAEALRDLNRKIVELGEKLGKPVVATTDAHYAEPEDAIYRNILFAGQGYKDAENGEGLYMRTTNEMLEEFSYLGEETARKVVIDNTRAIADMVEEIVPVPSGKYPPKIAGSEETLRETCMKRAHELYGDPLPPEIGERLEKELSSIIGNGYAVMYVSAQMLVNKSMADGYLVGSRGSVGSSLAATMAGITEVNPLAPHYLCPKCKKLEWGEDIYGKGVFDCGVDMEERNCPDCGTLMIRDGYTIPFETFLGFDGDKEPDIDLNFAGEYQPVAHRYVGEIFGEKNVFKAGTVGTVADKTAFGFIKKYCEEKNVSAGKYETERLVKGCEGVKRTTGQHPGGMIIVPDDHEIYEFCPVQYPANDASSGMVTTHFDYHKIDQNLLKLDILGHDVPSMMRQLQELTGINPQEIPLHDDKVIAIFTGVDTLDIKDKDYKFTHGSYAIPEFGTSFVRKMLDDTKPQKVGDLVRIAGFSHGTDVWLNNAQEFILSGVANMNEVISTRDDIMNYLILKGLPNASAFQIMEKVRKGKGVTEEQEQLMRENDVPDWYIESCKRIKYMFPRAHAVAYVMMGYRLAWFKVYEPLAFYAAYFSTKVADFNSETILKGKEAVMKAMDAINLKGKKDMTTKEERELTVYEVAYEMYCRGYEFMTTTLGVSPAMKFTVADGKVVLPFGALEGVGETAANAFAAEYEKREFATIEEAKIRAGLDKNAIEALKKQGVFEGLPETDQLSMF